MNKKGFTLVELIAVIALLGVLVILAMPNLISLRNNVTNGSLKSKLQTIHSAAIDYAQDRLNSVPSPLVPQTLNGDPTYKLGDKTYNSNCLQVKIATLIEEGYLAVTTAYTNKNPSEVNGEIETNTTRMYSPVNNVDITEYFVCVRYDKNNVNERKLIAYVYDECSLFTVDTYKKECYSCGVAGSKYSLSDPQCK